MWMSGYTGAAQAAKDQQSSARRKYFAAAAEICRGNPCPPVFTYRIRNAATSDWLGSAGKCAPDTVGRTGFSGVCLSPSKLQLCNLFGHSNRAFFCKTGKQSSRSNIFASFSFSFTNICLPACLTIKRCGWPQSHDDAPGSLACRSASHNHQKSLRSRGLSPLFQRSRLAAEYPLCSQ